MTLKSTYLITMFDDQGKELESAEITAHARGLALATFVARRSVVAHLATEGSYRFVIAESGQPAIGELVQPIIRMERDRG